MSTMDLTLLGKELLESYRTQGRTLSCAESCTGGLLSAYITANAGSSDVFVGGVSAYSNLVKHKILGVSQEILDTEGAVSESSARSMASGVRRLLGTSAAVAITGIAGPNGGSPEKPVGTVWLAIDIDGKVDAMLCNFTGSREEIRLQCVEKALRSLLGA